MQKKFTKRASEVLDFIKTRETNAYNLWEKICDASRGVVLGILPKLLFYLSEEKCVLPLAQRNIYQPDIHNSKKYEISSEDEVVCQECQTYIGGELKKNGSFIDDPSFSGERIF